MRIDNPAQHSTATHDVCAEVEIYVLRGGAECRPVMNKNYVSQHNLTHVKLFLQVPKPGSCLLTPTKMEFSMSLQNGSLDTYLNLTRDAFRCLAGFPTFEQSWNKYWKALSQEKYKAAMKALGIDNVVGRKGGGNRVLRGLVIFSIASNAYKVYAGDTKALLDLGLDLAGTVMPVIGTLQITAEVINGGADLICAGLEAPNNAEEKARARLNRLVAERIKAKANLTVSEEKDFDVTYDVSVPDEAVQAFYDAVKDYLFIQLYQNDTRGTATRWWFEAVEPIFRAKLEPLVDGLIDSKTISFRNKQVTGLKAALASGIGKTPKKPTATPTPSPTPTFTATFTISPTPTPTPTVTPTPLPMSCVCLGCNTAGVKVEENDCAEFDSEVAAKDRGSDAWHAECYKTKCTEVTEGEEDDDGEPQEHRSRRGCYVQPYKPDKPCNGGSGTGSGSTSTEGDTDTDADTDTESGSESEDGTGTEEETSSTTNSGGQQTTDSGDETTADDETDTSTSSGGSSAGPGSGGDETVTDNDMTTSGSDDDDDDDEDEIGATGGSGATASGEDSSTTTTDWDGGGDETTGELTTGGVGTGGGATATVGDLTTTTTDWDDGDNSTTGELTTGGIGTGGGGTTTQGDLTTSTTDWDDGDSSTTEGNLTTSTSEEGTTTQSTETGDDAAPDTSTETGTDTEGDLDASGTEGGTTEGTVTTEGDGTDGTTDGLDPGPIPKRQLLTQEVS